MQLKVNQLLLNRHKVDASKEDVKVKVVVEIDDFDEHEVNVRRKRPINRGQKRALQQQREASPPKTHMIVDELILK